MYRKSEQTRSVSREMKPSRIKHNSLPRKKNKIKEFSQNNKKFFEDIITGEGFRTLERLMNCYFQLKNTLIR